MTSVRRPAEGEVFDIGYQPYVGKREGPWHARVAIWRDGVRTSLGLGRSAGQKVLPFLFIALTWGVALILITVIVIVGGFDFEPGDNESTTFSAFYFTTQLFMTLFAATVAPELLCPDRRDGVLSLYLVRPITRIDYVAARWLAFLTVMLAVVWLPQVLLFAASALVNDEPFSWMQDNWLIVPRIFAVGALIAVMLTSFAMMVASFTDRRMIAAIATVAALLLGTAIGEMQIALAPGLGYDLLSAFVSPWSLIFALNFSIFGQVNEDTPQWFNVWSGLLVFSLLVTALCTTLWWRYRTLRL